MVPYPQPYHGYHPAQKERPTGITLLAIVYLFSGLIMILILFLFGATFEDRMPEDVDALSSTIFITITIVCILVGRGLWKLQSWARIAAIYLVIIGLVFSLIGPDICGLLFQLLILGYLSSSKVKAAFKQGPNIPQQRYPEGPSVSGPQTPKERYPKLEQRDASVTLIAKETPIFGTKICPKCKNKIPIASKERPLKVTCPGCSTSYTLKEKGRN